MLEEIFSPIKNKKEDNNYFINDYPSEEKKRNIL